MDFDAEVDALKKKLAEERLSPEQVIAQTEQLRERLARDIASRRLDYVYDFDEEDGPRVTLVYVEADTGTGFELGAAWPQSDGGVLFMSESEYFPPVAAFDTVDDFIKEAREFLKEGLAALELDEESDQAET